MVEVNLMNLMFLVDFRDIIKDKSETNLTKMNGRVD